jgi:hypothetical protein
MIASTITQEHFAMSSTIFDTLAYAKKLKAAGVPENQAEIQAEAIAEIIDEKLATKNDLKLLETTLRRDINEMEEKLTYKLTIRFGSMLIAAVTVLAILIKIL